MTDKPLTEQEVREWARYDGAPKSLGPTSTQAVELARDWLRLQQRLAEVERERDDKEDV